MLKDIRPAGQQLAIQQVHHQRRDATGGTATGTVGDFLADQGRHMGQTVIEQLDLSGRSPFLRRINVSRATLAAQRVVHIGHQGETAVEHSRRYAQGLDSGNSLQRFPAGIEVMSIGIQKFGTQGTHDAHCRVAGRRAAQSQHDVTAATLHGVAHHQPRAQGACPHHVARIIGHQSQAAGGCHLDERRAVVTQEITGIDRRQLHQRSHRHHINPFTPTSFGQHHGRAVATVGHGDTYRPNTIKTAQDILCGPVELLRRGRAFEFVKRQNDLHVKQRVAPLKPDC